MKQKILVSWKVQRWKDRARLFLKGFRPPMFQLWVYHTSVRSTDPYSCVNRLLNPDPSIKHNKFSFTFNEVYYPKIRYEYKLWPDGQLWHFRWIGILLSLTLFFSGGSFFWSLVLFLSLVVLVPTILFTLSPPVLTETLEDFPPPLVSSFQQIRTRDETWRKDLGLSENRIKNLLISCWLCLVPIKAWQQKISGVKLSPAHYEVFQPHGSPQESILRLAMGEFFASEARGLKDFSCDPGFWRWLIYWCAPVWSGFTAIFFLAFLAIIGKGEWICAKSLVAPGIVWGVATTYLVLGYVCDFPGRIIMSRDEILRLPVHLQCRFNRNNSLQKVFEQITFKGIIALTQTFLFSVYLALVWYGATTYG
ncbi:MAG: hypothetical protein HQL69_13915 [Magnetococcales bacterium]|nr:hypothetical protein [Magnetococcales bacterium]